ncbi:MAG: L-threonylcarbamoyladenylate synthase [Labedaea sp.]
MNDELITSVHECLLRGGVVLLPTDTVYGLAVHPERDEAAERLFRMKRRPRARNLPIMVAATADLPALGAIVNVPARRLLEAFAPGPLTVALGLRPGAAPEWLAGRVEIGVRIPADEDLRALLQITGPLLATSANVHAQATRESVAEILADLDGAPDLVIDGGPRDTTPSTLVNCNLPEPVIERLGMLSAEQIEKVLQ